MTKCYIHPEDDAAGTCSRCGKPVCSSCSIKFNDRLICRSCVKKAVATKKPTIDSVISKTSNISDLSDLHRIRFEPEIDTREKKFYRLVDRSLLIIGMVLLIIAITALLGYALLGFFSLQGINFMSTGTPTPLPPYLMDPNSIGSIMGTVYDSRGKEVPNANVTLWQDGKLISLPDNPQLSSDGRTLLIGKYYFEKVPFGRYTVRAEIKGYNSVTIVDLNSPLSSSNIVIEGYTYSNPFIL
ncbi:carboxypeptidase-like regulatory domain-containing protein [Methanooceanicella nereidis]|uniref:carboxypeptidase-like regulatory domain-containing protein n=1 Tax=Methanooceanicella nereidis TaxID=2052831 RepID=UPI001E5C1798|nr:carboxypeptidase-like regulatory domain-containing protein [Methanocella sp. CWC-04]